MDQVRYVQRIRRRTGVVDLYFRKRGHREGPLRSRDGSLELKAEVDAILARIARAHAAQTPKAGTVGGAIQRYRKSADFIRLARSTQKEYERLLREIEADVGEVRLEEVDKGWITELRDLWAPRGYKAANDRLQVLKNALTPAVNDERIKADPFLKLKKLAPPHSADEVNLPGQTRKLTRSSRWPSSARCRAWPVLWLLGVGPAFVGERSAIFP